MKRTWLLGLTLVLSAGLLGSPSATAALPTSAVLKDARDDVSPLGKSKKRSHPLDIYKLTAARAGKNLAITVTTDDLTRKNTGSFTVDNPDGSTFRSVRTVFRVDLKLDGVPYEFGATVDDHVMTYRNGEYPGWGYCGDPDLTRTSVDLTRDTVRMLVPLNCLDNPRVGKILGGTVFTVNTSPQLGDKIVGPSTRFQLR